MIRSFADKESEAIWNGLRSRKLTRTSSKQPAASSSSSKLRIALKTCGSHAATGSNS